MDYGGWLATISKTFQGRFDEISASYNFDLGDEFEIAVAEALRKFLPDRVGICRGFIVEQNGAEAGDDLILFDQQRFPPLKPLADALRLKHRVPVEAVLAYIEVKNTLYVSDSDGQSASKAVKQTSDVKVLRREAVPIGKVAHVQFNEPFNIRRPHKGWPEHLNPYYTAIIARHVYKSPKDRTEPSLSELSNSIVTANQRWAPDCVCAGGILALPAYLDEEKDEDQIRPFLVAGNRLNFFSPTDPLGCAVAHLLWAIGEIQLGDIPWPALFTDRLGLIGAALEQH